MIINHKNVDADRWRESEDLAGGAMQKNPKGVLHVKVT